MKVKLYKVRAYQAYRSDETGIRWFNHKPSDNAHYKFEILDEKEFELPDGITYDDEFEQFSDNGKDCTLVNENGTVWLVSSERMIKWF